MTNNTLAPRATHPVPIWTVSKFSSVFSLIVLMVLQACNNSGNGIDDKPLQPPVAEAAEFTLPEDTEITGSLSSESTFAVIYSIDTDPSDGTVTLLNANTGKFIYKPAKDYYGPDNFSFIVSDGAAYQSAGVTQSAAATVNLSITPVADTPQADDAVQTINTNAIKTGRLAAFDPDDDTLTFTFTTSPTLGSIKMDNATTGDYTYNANSDEFGEDIIKFTVNDGTVDSAEAELKMIINTVPIAVSSSLNVVSTTVTDGTINATDVDEGVLTYEIVSNPVLGTLIVDPQSGKYSYTADAGVYGQDSFNFIARDTYSRSRPAKVEITVWPRYTLVDLGQDTDDRSSAIAINNAGEVVGNFSPTSSPLTSTAYVSNLEGVRTPLTEFTASGIADPMEGNSAGLVIGHRKLQTDVVQGLIYDRNSVPPDCHIG